MVLSYTLILEHHWTFSIVAHYNIVVCKCGVVVLLLTTLGRLVITVIAVMLYYIIRVVYRI